jgi:hypothetical protein
MLIPLYVAGCHGPAGWYPRLMGLRHPRLHLSGTVPGPLCLSDLLLLYGLALVTTRVMQMIPKECSSATITARVKWVNEVQSFSFYGVFQQSCS